MHNDADQGSMHTRPFEFLIAAWTQVLVFLGLALGLILARSGLGLGELSVPSTEFSGLWSPAQALVVLALGFLLVVKIPLLLKASRVLFICCPLSVALFLALTVQFFPTQGLAALSPANFFSADSTFSTGQLWWSGLMALWMMGTAPALLSPRCHWLFLNPNMRWWLSAERRAIKNKVVLNTPSGHSLLSTTQDLSRTGAFVPMAPNQFERLGLNLGDHLEFKLWSHNDYKNPLNLSAQVVRYGTGRIWSEQGVGLHFIEPDPHTQTEVDKLIAETDR